MTRNASLAPDNNLSGMRNGNLPTMGFLTPGVENREAASSVMRVVAIGRAWT
jgi:hypothetical protein